MEADQLSRRIGKRKPLADCTNTIPKSSQSSSSTSIIKPTNPSVSSALKRLLNDTNTKPHSKSGFRTGSTTDNRKGVVAVTNPSSAALPLASTPSRPRNSSSVSGTGGYEVFEPCSVYTRRQTADKRKSKGKLIAESMSCPLVAKISSSGDKMNEEGNISLSKSYKVPHKKKQRKLTSEQDVSNHALPKDFIEQQRAYFAEIDAFELPEEEVTTVDELE